MRLTLCVSSLFPRPSRRHLSGVFTGSSSPRSHLTCQISSNYIDLQPLPQIVFRFDVFRQCEYTRLHSSACTIRLSTWLVVRLLLSKHIEMIQLFLLLSMVFHIPGSSNILGRHALILSTPRHQCTKKNMAMVGDQEFGPRELQILVQKWRGDLMSMRYPHYP